MDGMSSPKMKTKEQKDCILDYHKTFTTMKTKLS